MPIIPTGTPIEEKLIFNSGYIDFGGDQLVDVENIVVDITFVEKEIRRLNSIKIAAHKRATVKCGLKAKTRSINKEVLIQLMGTNTPEASGRTISVLDGQATLLNPVFTAFVDDDTDNPIQFQFTDAILLVSPTTTALEDFGTMDLELVARDVKTYVKYSHVGLLAGMITLEREYWFSPIAGLITLEATP